MQLSLTWFNRPVWYMGNTLSCYAKHLVASAHEVCRPCCRMAVLTQLCIMYMCAAGNDQKSGTSAAPQQPTPPQAIAAPQAQVTGPSASALSPTASSASLRPPTTQVPASGTVAQSQHHFSNGSGMPLGAVDMSRAGGPAPAVADDTATEGASTGLVRH